MVKKGLITHSISGFYYVEAADAVYECRAKGVFRKNHMTPLAGDIADIETDGEKGTVTRIYDRKNFLQRPPVANIDILFIVSSLDRPKPNLFVIDKLSAFAVYHGINPVIVLSKCDLGSPEEYKKIYEKAGFRVICTSVKDGSGIEEIKEIINGRICAFAGNSGVGKSSLINSIIPGIALETNDISDKLGRGKHTTRSVALYKAFGGYIADTPGFSSLDFEENGERIFKDELSDCFPEFAPFVQQCKFYPSCSHVSDKGCAVAEAVKNGNIPAERHQSYCRMYEEVKNFKKWEE